MPEEPGQLGLFPSDQLPEDLLDDLNIVTGAKNIMEEMAGDPLSRLNPAFKGTKYEDLKKEDRVRKDLHAEGVRVRTLDLATAEGEAEMAGILELVGNPKNQMGYAETPPHFMPDPAAPRGYRTIVVVRWWRIRTVVTPLGSGATP